MKRLISLLLILALLLCGCGGETPETETTEAPSETPTEAPTEAPTEMPTEAPTEAPTEVPTEAPTEPPVIYRHPLTGAILDAPHETRIVSLSVGNSYDAMPTYGLSQVDMLFELYVNGLTTRLLALYGDPTGVPAIGSIRSHRYHFTDLSQSYDTLAFHAGYSDHVGGDASRSGIPNMNVDTNSSTSYSFRDKERNATGIAMFHCLMAKGDGLYGLAEERGYSTAFNPDKDYRMTFTDGAALTEGDSAKSVTLTFHLQDSYKKSQFAYNEETGLYEFTQYGNLMVDANNGETVAFRNLFFLSAETWTDADGYHVSTLIGSGEGWFACDGYMVPIQWHREADTEPFSFTLADGTPLVQGVGSSYVAIAPTQSTLAAE